MQFSHCKISLFFLGHALLLCGFGFVLRVKDSSAVARSLFFSRGVRDTDRDRDRETGEARGSAEVEGE